ncbi:MAG TPA: MarR family transcriptional regulator [Thermomonospora sp.]|nr:MarR family transcriptional regulator [Thermomonospora sp.]
MTGPQSEPSPPAEPAEAEELARLAETMDEPAGTLAAAWASGQDATLPVPATQLRVLFVVERHGSINLSGLAGELGALLSSASRLCDRLEAAGLLARVPGRDRRAVELRLSRDGELLLSRLRERRRRELARVLAQMTPAARTALLTGLLHFHTAATRDQRTGDRPVGMSRPA